MVLFFLESQRRCIVRIDGKVRRQSRTILQGRFFDGSIRSVLFAGIFADIVWIVEGSYQKERLAFLLALQERDGCLRQAEIIVSVQVLETECLFVRQ